MIRNRAFKVYVFAAFLLLFLAAVGAAWYREQLHCMAVPLIDEDELEQYVQNLSVDLHEITFCGETVPADMNSETIYISQAEAAHYSQLKGKLSTDNPELKLYFVKDEALFNIEQTIKTGKMIQLAAVQGRFCQKLNVVITTLPVLRLEESVVQLNHEGEQVAAGELAVFAGYDASLDNMNVRSYPAQWHLRGGLSRENPKKPWKVELREQSGEIRDADILGLGSDDDWILNPMSMDDTKIRERFAMELWNRYIYVSGAAYKMSDSEYVEVVMDGEYMGLYLLQRRIDAKYMGLDRNKDILMKGITGWTEEGLYKDFEIIYSPLGMEETYGILEQVLRDGNMNIDSLIAMNLYLQFFYAIDNMSDKNMFYLLRHIGGKYQMHFIPWDTDMSMGLVWTEGFEYDYESAQEYAGEHIIYEELCAEYPELDEMSQKRWNELKCNMYEPQTLEELLWECEGYIGNSGAYERDKNKWGLRYDGADTMDGLRLWCNERQITMDEHYQKRNVDIIH